MKRNDGRENSDIRNVEFVLNAQKDPSGSVLIRWGNTHVLCSVTVEEKAPHWLQGQGQGWITAEYGMLPGSSDKRISRDRSRNNGRTHEIQRLIGRSLRNAIDLKILGERTVSIDCDVLQADGGTRVASIVGASVALQLAAKKIGLRVRPKLVSAVSLGLIKGEILVDLAYTEDAAAEVDSNVVILESGELCEVQATAEKGTFSVEQWQSMLGQAQKACQQIIQIQKQILGL